MLTAGVTSARFAISPSASVSLRNEGWFFVARDTGSFLGATGGRFGINNETTLGAGLFGELVNVSAGLSLNEYSLPICGAQRCGQVYGLNGAAVAAKVLPEVLAWDGTSAPAPLLVSLAREFLVTIGMAEQVGVQ